MGVKITPLSTSLVKLIPKSLAYKLMEIMRRVDDSNAEDVANVYSATSDSNANEIAELRELIESQPSPKDYGYDVSELETKIVSEVFTVKTQRLEAWPVGSIFTSVVSTNPFDLLGYGTWAAFGTGRVLIGLDAGDGDFDAAEETGGAKTHNHAAKTSGTPSATATVDNDGAASTVEVASGTHTHDTDLDAINHMPPFIAVYFWKRTS